MHFMHWWGKYCPETRYSVASEAFDVATKAAIPPGMVVVPREIIANFAQSTHVPRFRRICEAALAAYPDPPDNASSASLARFDENATQE